MAGIGYGYAPDKGFLKKKIMTNQGRVVGFDNSMSAKPKIYNPLKPYIPSGDRFFREKPLEEITLTEVPLRRLF